MAAGDYDIYVEQGADWELIVTIYDNAGSPVDITGATAAMQIRDRPSGAIVAEPTIEITDAENGEITLSLTATETAAISVMGATSREVASYVYDLKVTHAGGEVERVLNGAVNVSPEVTKA